MKKNISINLQGLIFHIEEDGYEVLGRYLAEVKAHFSGYRGHEEIVADIEGRIAELFAARVSASKQVITLDDVQAMVAKMGRVSDFQSADEAEEEEEALAGGATTYSTYTANGTATAGTTTATSAGPRRLYRDMANRKIAGVAAGLAQYFAVNPLWVRLGFLALVFIRPISHRLIHFDGDNFNFSGFDLGGFALISYIVLWIALPKRYDTPPADEDPTFKKLYRDTDTGKVGGVSAGLAAYFKTDIVLIRILFVASVFAGGFGIPLYILLWILLPEAKSVSDKMRMRGDAVTLEGIDTKLRNNAFEADTTGIPASSNRPVGTFLEGLFRGIRPLLGFIGTLIRWFVGAALAVGGFFLLLAFTIALGVGLGWVPESQNFIHTGPFPPYLFMNSVPTWALFAFYFAGAIPALAMLLLGIGLLLRRSVLTRTASLSLLGLWLLSIVGSSIAAARISHDFQDEGTYSTTRSFAPIPYPTTVLQMHNFENVAKRPNITLVSADSGQAIRLEQEISARGATEAAGAATAANSVTYGVQQRDSVLTFDESVRFLPGATFRDQKVSLVLHLPRDKTYRLSGDFGYLLANESFVNNHRPDNVQNRRFRLRGNQLECISCTEAEMHDDRDENDNDDAHVDLGNGDNFHVHVNTDDKDGGVDVKVDLGKASFPTDLDSYGTGRRTFDNLSGFDRIEAHGAYRVYVRRGDTFKVEAAGEKDDLRDLRISTDGDQLTIRPDNDNNGFNLFDWGSSNRHPVLVRVTLPQLRELDFSGACRADVAGFAGQPLNVQQSGACLLALNVTTPKLTLGLSGASRAELGGQADELEAESSGVSQINALKLTAHTAQFNLSGASGAKIRVTQALRSDLSGASHLEYAGTPTEVHNETSGSSHVKRVTE